MGRVDSACGRLCQGACQCICRWLIRAAARHWVTAAALTRTGDNHALAHRHRVSEWFEPALEAATDRAAAGSGERRGGLRAQRLGQAARARQPGLVLSRARHTGARVSGAAGGDHRVRRRRRAAAGPRRTAGVAAADGDDGGRDSHRQARRDRRGGRPARLPSSGTTWCSSR